MSVARTWSVALVGLEGAVVEVEADLSRQLPDFRIIGLPDKSLGEAVQRVHNACANCALALPRRRITVNLSPASLPKHGSGFDVAIAVAALATDGLLDRASVAETAHLGELGLDGRLRPVPGILPAVLAAAKSRIRQVVVPVANRAEAELVSGVRVIAAAHLAEVARLHGAEVDDPELPTAPATAAPPTD
ncbi:MAG: ATP-binding protein, partial [Microbacterium sp.]|nr:ATP-binding protein [Microbacterium sp.]